MVLPKSTNQGGFDFWDAYVTKLDPTGSTLIYSTYLGGSQDEYCYGLAVDINGRAEIGRIHKNRTKFDTLGALVYSSYLGGSTSEIGESVAVDANGNAYVTGFTDSTNFPSVNPNQPTLGGGVYDVFLTKVDAVVNQIVYSIGPVAGTTIPAQ